MADAISAYESVQFSLEQRALAEPDNQLLQYGLATL
jgi:hypothetical protein